MGANKEKDNSLQAILTILQRCKDILVDCQDILNTEAEDLSSHKENGPIFTDVGIALTFINMAMARLNLKDAAYETHSRGKRTSPHKKADPKGAIKRSSKKSRITLSES